MKAVQDKVPSAATLANNQTGFSQIMQTTFGKQRVRSEVNVGAPRTFAGAIASIPTNSGAENVAVMPQRFTLDSWALSKVTEGAIS